MMTFLAHRLARTKFTGLPLTVLIIVSAYFALLYLGGVLDIARNGRIVQVDIRVSQFLSGVRSPAVVRFFSIVTAFGYWGIVSTLAIAVSILLWLYHRQRYLIGLWITLAGNQISVNIIKLIFSRTRPSLAYYHETTYSFPSGHSAASAAFFGYATYILIREQIAATSLTMIGGVSAMLLVGSSRLMLGEHYLSDVVNGYLIGGLWVYFAVWFVAHRQIMTDTFQPTPTPGWRRYATFSVIAICAVTIWILATYYQSNLIIKTPPPKPQ